MSGESRWPTYDAMAAAADDLYPGMGGPDSPFIYLPCNTEERRAFLRVSVKQRAGHFPFIGVRPVTLWSLVRSHASRSDARAIVVATRNDPDVFAACFVVRNELLVHAFTKPELQQQGLMTTALADFGFDFLDPTPVLVWSAVASRIAAKGHYRIYPEVP